MSPDPITQSLFLFTVDTIYSCVVCSELLNSMLRVLYLYCYGACWLAA